MVVNEVLCWIFYSGVAKHLTSCKSFFASLKDAQRGTYDMCKHASYPTFGVGEIQYITRNRGIVPLKNA